MGPTPFTLSLPFSKTGKRRIAVDDRLRVLMPPAVGADGRARSASEPPPGPHALADVSILQEESSAEGGAATSLGDPVSGVYALGDCCANEDAPLPALAQVAEQQGRYLAKVLNAEARARLDDSSAPPPFVYRSLGSMATVGEPSVAHQ